MKSYDYSHRSGVKQLGWDDFSTLARQIAEQLKPHHPQLILGIARAGLSPATAVACSLRCELFPIRLTRRVNDQAEYERPV
jgi:adenine/guanine phosphoribosyltransferase-like PRPP-binding protein